MGNSFKKRYRATVYLKQNSLDDRQVFVSGTFRFLWWAHICMFFSMLDYAELEAHGVITFEKEITPLCE